MIQVDKKDLERFKKHLRKNTVKSGQKTFLFFNLSYFVDKNCDIIRDKNKYIKKINKKTGGKSCCRINVGGNSRNLVILVPQRYSTIHYYTKRINARIATVLNMRIKG